MGLEAMEDQAEKLREIMRQKRVTTNASLPGTYNERPVGRAGNGDKVPMHEADSGNREKRKTRIITITSGKGERHVDGKVSFSNAALAGSDGDDTGFPRPVFSAGSEVTANSASCGFFGGCC